MSRKIAIEEVRSLAESERMMDDGRAKFVMFSGGRVAVEESVMDKLGLAQGQTISHKIFEAVIRANLDHVNMEIAKEEAEKAAGQAMLQQ